MNTVLDSQQLKLEPYDSHRLASLCGQCNEHLKLIEQRFPVQIFNRGNLFELQGDQDTLFNTAQLLDDLYQDTATGQFLTPQCVHLKIREFRMHEGNQPMKESQLTEKTNTFQSNTHFSKTNSPAKKQEFGRNESRKNSPKTTINFFASDDTQTPTIISTLRKDVKLRGENQQNYIQNIKNNDVNFGIGPAGTGKTYLAVACAVTALEQDLVDKIILVRPAVEAGEKLGFLPGDLAEKVNPYLRPLYDALDEMFGFEKVEKLMERKLIEIAPLAYMRGRTLSNSFIILDESQNTTKAQMKMFLTRIGFGSKAIITGDQTQIDLPRGVESGLVNSIKVLKNVKGIGFSHFTAKDVVRHPLVQSIVEAYDNEPDKDL